MTLLIEKYNFKFIAGVGDYDKNEVCILSGAVAEWRLRNGEPLGEATDRLECFCPVIRRLCLSRGCSTDNRKEWALAMIPRLLGSRNDALTIKRARIVALYALRVIAPRALRQAGFTEDAETLTALPDDVDLKAASDVAYLISKRATAVHDTVKCASCAASTISACAAAGYASTAAIEYTIETNTIDARVCIAADLDTMIELCFAAE